MADPLSIAAGVAGLLGLGIQVVEQYLNWYEKYKSADKDVSRMMNKLESLLQLLQYLDALLSQRTFSSDEAQLLQKVENAIYDCRESISGLIDDLKVSVEHVGSGSRTKLGALGKRVLYPLRASTLQRLDEEIADIRDNISLAVSLLQLKDLQTANSDHDAQKDLLERIRGAQVATEVRSWLNASDATTNHNVACSKKHYGTGNWFVKSDVFKAWLQGDISLLWLKGFAGCGKSILCSTAIQHSLRFVASNGNVGLGIFYFSFSDVAKQSATALLKAFLLQLSGQAKEGANLLDQLHANYTPGTPPNHVLLEYLRTFTELFDGVLFLIDALDESPRDTERTEVLRTIHEMNTWSSSRIHILVTSRPTTDIQDYLRLDTPHEVELDNNEIDLDIEAFVADNLKQNPLLQKFSSHHETIGQILSSRAKGVFRWVECQLKALERCPSSTARLEKCLSSLPRTLDETYERILCSIDEDSAEDARRILTLLCFSARPLMMCELIEGIAMDLSIGHLDTRRFYTRYDDIQDLCPGLIIVYQADIPQGTTGFPDNTYTDYVRLAHFSVQEYLRSDRISVSKAAHFQLTSGEAHHELAEICLRYLHEPSLSEEPLEPEIVRSYPLAPFAAEYWAMHYINAIQSDSLDSLVSDLFERPQDIFENWLKLHDISNPRKSTAHESSFCGMYGSPLYYACYIGSMPLVKRLLYRNKLDATQIGNIINVHEGYCSGPLGAASSAGQLEVARLLVENGAKINLMNEGDMPYTNPLHEACKMGHLAMAQLLLSHGASVNFLCRYGTALYYASAGGREDIVKLLLDHGADPNVVGKEESPLMSAVENGNMQVAKILLDAGADIYYSCSRDKYGSLVHALGLADNAEIKDLLSSYKDDSYSVEKRDNALVCAAMLSDHEWTTELVQRGANVNHCAMGSSTAIQQASGRNRLDIVTTLIASGADVNEAGEWDTALSSAASRGSLQMVKLLLDSGADVNQGWKSDGTTPLQQAASTGHQDIVQVLIENGADVDLAGSCCNALTMAILGLAKDTISNLIRAGARSIGPGNLQHAQACGHQHIAHLLLKNGIGNFNQDCEHEPQCRVGFTPEQMTTFEEIRELLLTNGVVDQTLFRIPCCCFYYEIYKSTVAWIPQWGGKARRRIYAATPTVLDI